MGVCSIRSYLTLICLAFTASVPRRGVQADQQGGSLPSPALLMHDDSIRVLPILYRDQIRVERARERHSHDNGLKVGCHALSKYLDHSPGNTYTVSIIHRFVCHAFAQALSSICIKYLQSSLMQLLRMMALNRTLTNPHPYPRTSQS